MPNEDQLREEWLKVNVELCESHGVELTGYEITAYKLMADWWLSKFHEHNKGIVEMIEKAIRTKDIPPFQPFGYTEEKLEYEIYNDGFKDGRTLLTITIMGALEDIKNKLQNNGGKH